MRQAGQADKFYYMHTDHLGSIIRITDGSGATVFAATYDAWGLKMVTTNTIGFHRGFTGHEHLPEFGLVNMNARLYDPILGRFLSPDPFVPNPLFSQDYNRYMYARNNPLIYTDPTGELVWLIPVVGAIVGSYIGKSVQSKDWRPHKGWSDGWQGAIAGAFVGATAGAWVASTFFASSMTSMMTAGYSTAQTVGKGWGITNTMLNTATLNIGWSAISGGGWDGAWKAGIMGALSGGWTATGGFGLVNTNLLGKTLYQNVGLGLQSVGSNFASGRSAFERYNIGIGPLQLTLGKGVKFHQSLLNANNVFHAFNLTNVLFNRDMNVSFDRRNLSFEYHGGRERGFVDWLTTRTGESGAYGILSFYKDSKFDLHETFHVWQSRSMGNAFLPNYFFNALQKLSIYNFNYFEATADIYWQPNWRRIR